MATLAQLEAALINADRAGDMDAARKLASAVKSARADSSNLIPGAIIPETIQQAPEPTLGQQAIGAGEAALALGTGAIGGTAGMIGGALKGLAEQILSGQFGTPEAARLVEQSASKGAEALTYAPRTQPGQEQAQAVGEALQMLPPVIPIIGQAGAISQGARAAAPLAAATTRRAAAPVAQAAQKAGQAVQRIMPTIGREAGALPGSAGAAATPAAMRRVTTAEALPVPLTGESGLTLGQATREADVLGFEKETAKRAGVGEPLRARVENQSAALSKNFEVLIDRIDPIQTSLRGMGKSVDDVLKNKMGVANRKITAAYKTAREAGELEQPVELTQFADLVPEIDRFAGVAPNVKAINSEAVRLGALVPDAEGRLNPGKITIDNSELLRQFVNDATDWGDKRQAMIAKRVNAAIDASTENQGGNLYRAARQLKKDYINEFENVGLTKKLTTTKRGTTERNVALDDVFKKIIVDSPLEEMNKLRATLLKSGDTGKQSWKDLKAQGIEEIKRKAYSASQTDSRGNPLLSADGLTKAIQGLDAEGKLTSLYGKKQAQTLRDIAEIARDIYTAPPGVVNVSGTAAALANLMDAGLTFALTGIPAPAGKGVTEAMKYIQNRKLRARIAQSLKPLSAEGR